MDRVFTGQEENRHFVAKAKSDLPAMRTAYYAGNGWNIHHRIKKVLGGGDGLTNLLLLHPNCHRQLHANEAGSN